MPFFRFFHRLVERMHQVIETAKLEALTRFYQWEASRQPQQSAFMPRLQDGVAEAEQHAILKGKTYHRHGGCNGCGRCCEEIFLGHEGGLIQSVEMWEAIKEDHPHYGWFTPIELRDQGLLFRCKKLGADKRCTDYENRPQFCRDYPSEDGIILGGCQPLECSYWFSPAHTFKDVLSEKLHVHQS
ncbi:MAG: YkgJ family cysteine cluster protein [Vampirovibrionales bacterium]